MKTLSALAVVGFAAAHLVAAPFVNLDFEAADTNGVYPTGSFGYGGAAARLLPGWQLRSGSGEPVSFAGFNLLYTGGQWTTIYDVAYRVGTWTVPGPEGRYGWAAFPGHSWVPPYPLVLYTLAQVGDIPPDARSLQFLSWGDPFEVRLGGQALPLAWEANLFTADVSPFAGQTLELSFTTQFLLDWTRYNALDSIRFSTEPAPIPFIPEPSTWALLALGGVAVAWRVRRQSSGCTRLGCAHSRARQTRGSRAGSRRFCPGGAAAAAGRPAGTTGAGAR